MLIPSHLSAKEEVWKWKEGRKQTEYNTQFSPKGGPRSLIIHEMRLGLALPRWNDGIKLVIDFGYWLIAWAMEMW